MEKNSCSIFNKNEDRPSDHLAAFLALAAIITIFPVCYVIFGSL